MASPSSRRWRCGRPFITLVSLRRYYDQCHSPAQTHLSRVQKETGFYYKSMLYYTTFDWLKIWKNIYLPTLIFSKMYVCSQFALKKVAYDKKAQLVFYAGSQDANGVFQTTLQKTCRKKVNNRITCFT